MTKLERLRKEALAACEYRGHKMKRFQKIYNGIVNTAAFSNCKICDKQVVVIKKPQPNEIDVGGEAVALGCGG